MAAAPAPLTTTCILSMLLAGDFRAVEKRRRGDDRRAVLVVVHEGDVQFLAQALSISKHSGALMSSRLMPPKVGAMALTVRDELLGIGRVDLDVEGVDAGKGLEKHAFALHDRLGRQRTDVAQSEHGGAVRDHRYQVALARVLVHVVRSSAMASDGAATPGE